MFSFISLDLKELPIPNFEKSYSHTGEWLSEKDPNLIGGTLLSHKFVNNPQYKIQIPEPTQV